jgi:hypothetical protein
MKFDFFSKKIMKEISIYMTRRIDAITQIYKLAFKD